MYCDRCGATCRSDAEFCWNCGAAIRQAEGECTAGVPLVCPKGDGSKTVGTDPVCDNVSNGSAGESYCPARHVLASRCRRLVGHFVDWVLFGAVVSAFYFISKSTVVGWASASAYAGLQAFLLNDKGQTIGKMVVGTRIVKAPDGSSAGFAEVVLLRSALPILVVVGTFLLLIALGFASFQLVQGGVYGTAREQAAMEAGVALWLLPLLDVLFIFRDDRRCLHDLLAGTKVVMVEHRL